MVFGKPSILRHYTSRFWAIPYAPRRGVGGAKYNVRLGGCFNPEADQIRLILG